MLSIERPDLGIQFVMRNNFNDWNVSVISEREIKATLAGFDGSRSDCFFEGFPSDLMFDGFDRSRARFSISLHDDYELYAFVREVMIDVRAQARASAAAAIVAASVDPDIGA